MSRVACRWEGESVNHCRGNCYAKRSRRINTLHTYLRPSVESHHRPTVSLEARCIATQISMGFIRTLPCVVCAGDVSRVSFLDLFGPVAIQLCNHFSGEYTGWEIYWFLPEKLPLDLCKRPLVDDHYFLSKLVSYFISILLTRKLSWKYEIINVLEIIPGYKCKLQHGTFLNWNFSKWENIYLISIIFL